MEQLEQVTDSLYDFIYIDDHKSRILLAQLVTNGIVTEIKEKLSKEESSVGEAGFDKVFVVKKSGGKSDSSSSEQSFDTSLSIHLSLLNKLSEQNRINRDITAANIGDIVLFSGEVNVLDISTIQKLSSSIHLFTDSKKIKI